MLGFFLLAQIAGLLSHVPGGLGVFEAVMLWSLTPPNSLLEHPFTQPQVLGALVAFRGIYYLLPLGCAVIALGTHEVAIRSEGAGALLALLERWMPPFVLRRLAARLGHGVPLAVPRETVRLIGQWAPALVPNVFAFATFVAGALLLFSGATPGVRERLFFMNAYIPERLMEVAHLLASMVGAALLLLARGLQRRLDLAYLLTVILLAAGIPFSLIKGFDYEEATVLLVILIAFIPCRPHFYRKASLLSRYSISPAWAAAIALTIAGSIWLGLFSYKRVQYSHHLWIHFSLRGDASKFLRASVGAIGVVALYGLKILLRPAPPESEELTEEDWQAVRDIVETSPRTYAWSALLRDKRILLNRKRNAFIMYGIEGRSWVALGDPVGPEEEKAELAWQFRELSDAAGGWTVFYHVLPDHLPLYLDLGLVLLKLGEEAMVPLENFTIEGKARKSLRQIHHKVAREGYQFQIAPVEAVPALLPQMRRISNAWLAAKHTREKGFSLGFFSEPYLKELPVALVRDAEGRLVAFANIWPGAGCEELSIDMMRYVPELHQGIMDYLFVELMLWGRERGYKWFNLGMAPLSGLENRSLAPLWVRIGAIIFRHGEHFYNFQGLRQYKEKYDPVWVPKYVASPGGIALPRVLTNVAALISHGLKGVVAK
jgi:phosphatidylglycerol lysyltransferase